jgi:hypothetical protein
MRWSDDKLQSTLHRVRIPRADEYLGPRYSLPFFCQPTRRPRSKARQALRADHGARLFAAEGHGEFCGVSISDLRPESWIVFG